MAAKMIAFKNSIFRVWFLVCRKLIELILTIKKKTLQIISKEIFQVK